MSNTWMAPKQDVKRAGDPTPVESLLDVVVALPFESWAARQSDDAIPLDSCRRFERILVTTRYSVYELIIVGGDDGDVLVRGGRAFPDFRRARVIGSTAGGSALTVRSIDVGRRLELHTNEKTFLTSRIQALLRIDAPCDVPVPEWSD